LKKPEPLEVVDVLVCALVVVVEPVRVVVVPVCVVVVEPPCVVVPCRFVVPD